jgi:phenylalanyl-tRNA synthetase beta chain
VPYQWLCELVKVPDDVEGVAAALALRGFEVASIERGRDAVIDFEITANRPDCLSIIGLAREASAAYGVPLQLPDRAMPPAGQPQPIDVVIEDAGLCPRYCAQVFEVRSSAPSPAWMQERLEAAGVRSISAIVDVTNYVMLETGQPTHAFDYAKLAGKALRIRRARAGEKLRTLDGVDRDLQSDMLVIADGDRAQAIGGVMGGATSEIGALTKLMVLESAYFKPGSIRRTSKRLGLKTEASTRFERGADVNAAPAAIARAAALLQQIGAAQPLGPMIDRYPAPEPPPTVSLRSERITRVLGMPVADAAIPKILEPLGFQVEAGSARREAREENESGGTDLRPPTSDRAPRASHLAPRATWRVTVPSFRVDVLREIDLVEEIARHDGYASLPDTFPALTAAQPPPDPRTARDRLLRQVLTACGMSEAMTFAFIEAAAAAPFADPATAVGVANPLSEKYAVLRPSLLPGLIDAAAHNRRRERHDVRLFETGTRFSTAGETRGIAGVWCGAGTIPHWSGGAREADFFDVKGVVEALGGAFGVELEFAPASVPYLLAGRAATIDARLRTSLVRRLGLIGQLVPSVVEARGVPGTEPVWSFELDADALAAAGAGGDLRAESLPRFPSVVRDLSVLVDSTLPAAAVRGTIRSSAPSTLVDVIEFDRYRGKGIPEGRVSLSVRLTFRSAERTLTDAEVDEAMAAVVAALADAHGATRR